MHYACLYHQVVEDCFDTFEYLAIHSHQHLYDGRLLTAQLEIHSNKLQNISKSIFELGSLKMDSKLVVSGHNAEIWNIGPK
jgi:hypothetical protein